MKKNLIYFLAGFALLSSGIAAQSSGTAEEESVGETSGDSTSYNIDVTAQKRKNKVQEVPASVTVIDSKVISDAGITETKDIARYVPNMATYNFTNNFSYYSLRGQTNFNSFSNPIGIYIDEIPIISNGNRSDIQLWDIEQIEVLRGPQGNLYGLNSSGGVVNIKTKQPQNQLNVAGETSYGSNNVFDARAKLSGAVVKDILYFGISGNYNREDSYIEEQSNDDRDSYFGGGRGKLIFKPNDKVEVALSVESGHRDANFITYTIKDDNPYKIDCHNHDEYDRDTYHTQSVMMHFSLPLFDVISITAHSKNHMEGSIEYFTGGSMYSDWNMNTRKIVQEVRFVSNDKNSNLNWLAGFFVQDALQTYQNDTYYMGSLYTGNETDIDQKTYSIFGEISYKLMDLITFTPGLRYDYDKKSFDKKSSSLNLDDTNSWKCVSPRFSVDVTPVKDIMIYASVAKGNKAGGYALAESKSADDALFDEEKIISYEAGLKTILFSGKILFNIAGFYSDVDDMQLFRHDPATNAQIYTNAGKAVVYGIESELSARFVKGLEISIPFGLTRAVIKEHLTREYEDNKVPFVPFFTSGFATQFTHKSGIFGRVDIKMLGKTYFDEGNKKSQASYGVLDLKAGYKTDYCTISAYAKNITDKQYYNLIMEYNSLDFATVGAPRTFGVQVSGEF